MGTLQLTNGLYTIPLICGPTLTVDADLCHFHGKSLTILSCRGSVVQQAVSSLTQLPVDMFQGSGQQFHTLGESTCLLVCQVLLTSALRYRFRILDRSRQPNGRFCHMAIGWTTDRSVRGDGC